MPPCVRVKMAPRKASNGSKNVPIPPKGTLRYPHEGPRRAGAGTYRDALLLERAQQVDGVRVGAVEREYAPAAPVPGVHVVPEPPSLPRFSIILRFNVQLWRNADASAFPSRPPCRDASAFHHNLRLNPRKLDFGYCFLSGPAAPVPGVHVVPEPASLPAGMNEVYGKPQSPIFWDATSSYGRMLMHPESGLDCLA